MKTIQALRLEGLRLGAEMAFYNFVISAVEKYSVVGTRFATAFAMFKAAYDRQNDLYMRHDRKALTDAVQKAEAKRDKWIRKLRSNVREVVEFGSGEKLEAAGLLATIIDAYGGAKIPGMKVEEETGVLLNLYEDLQQRYADEVELLGLTDVVAGAKAANDEFIEAQDARTQSDADYGIGVMEEARPVTAKRYRYFIDSVNVEAEIDYDGELTPFIDYMNAKIAEMRRLTNQGNSPAGSGGGSQDGVVAIVKKTATFVFHGGRKESLPVEVGTVIPVPSNTTGYKWKPAVPELMPSTNKTFKEVPIEDREVTLTFHFLDHEEEEMRGIVGTALVAPANTDGCYWEPAVPAVFPGEDVQYYEMAGGQGGPGEPGSPTDPSNPTDPSSPSTPNNPSNPNNPADPSLVDLFFTFHSGQVEEIRAAAGSALTAPGNTAGYLWSPEVPRTMPAENFRFVEVPEGVALHTVAWYNQLGNPVQWYELPAGMAIPEAPESPEGYEWHPYPDVMPDHDMDIIPNPVRG